MPYIGGNNSVGMDQGSPYGQYLRSSGKRGFDWRVAAPVGAMAAGPALAGLFTGGTGGAAAGALSTAQGVPGAVAAPVASGVSAGAATASAGRLATLGRLFNSPGAELGINAGLSLIGMRSQNKAADQARKDALAGQREAMALERQRLEMELTNANLDREEARALNAAINELKKRELDAMEEERAYNRANTDADRARRVPYQEASRAALGKLQSMWGIG